jgi:hypothetical protein
MENRQTLEKKTDFLFFQTSNNSSNFGGISVNLLDFFSFSKIKNKETNMRIYMNKHTLNLFFIILSNWFCFLELTFQCPTKFVIFWV